MTNDYPWIMIGIECVAGTALGLAMFYILSRIVRRFRNLALVDSFLRAIRLPVMLMLPLLFVQVAVSNVPTGTPFAAPVRHLLSIALIGIITFLCVRLVGVAAESMINRYSVDVPDNLKARSIHTQIRVFSRILSTLVIVIGVSALLMTFPGVRQIGSSLLASAGVAGLVAGFAARPVLGNLIAGMQIALAQPIRIDDVLIVNGEWGRVEEITGSYVVIRIWDERRLIVPLEWFIQNPFENWTRTSSQIMGTIFLWVDYSLPLAPLRDELLRVCQASPDWDGRVCGLQVTDTTERAVQLRALVSAQDASKAWDLRCTVREALIAYIQENHPACLPRLRTDIESLHRENKAPR